MISNFACYACRTLSTKFTIEKSLGFIFKNLTCVIAVFIMRSSSFSHPYSITASNTITWHVSLCGQPCVTQLFGFTKSHFFCCHSNLRVWLGGTIENFCPLPNSRRFVGTRLIFMDSEQLSGLSLSQLVTILFVTLFEISRRFGVSAAVIESIQSDVERGQGRIAGPSTPVPSVQLYLHLSCTRTDWHQHHSCTAHRWS